MADETNTEETGRPWLDRYFSVPLFVTLAIVVYILCFSDYSIGNYNEYKQRIDELNAEIKQNTDSFNYYHDLNQQLKTDPRKMEEVVREKYHMQHPNEDVYVFE